MDNIQAQGISELVLTSMTEIEFAQWYGEMDVKVIFHRNRYWKKTVLGFYEPLHYVARLNAEEATCPTPLSWGFRTALWDCDRKEANGSIPIHWLPNLKTYDFQSITSKLRNKIRKSYRLVNFIEVTDHKLLVEQGYEVAVSALMRAAYCKVPSKKDYIKKVNNYFLLKKRTIIAGFIDGKLGGYLVGYAVNGTAYIQDIVIASEALNTNIGNGLVFEFTQICRRSVEIHELFNGLHSREDENLCNFKEGMGFEVKLIPAKVEINLFFQEMLRKQYPHKYYRLTGHN